MEGEESSVKKGRGKRSSNPFLGGVGAFPGISNTSFTGLSEDGEEEGENSVEDEEYDGTEVVPAFVGLSEGTGNPTIAQSNQPGSPQSETSLFAIMQQMAQIMANLQSASSPEALRPSDCFDGIQTFKVRSFSHSFQIIFHNYQKNFSGDKKKALYATSFPIGRAAKCI
ncbi:hypothetical protein O181_002257 [Austropuccinia psidii MF-1]|uniref:Uncharacterized protein n=1 Tax=Austropuccinia psidii MF-1 TaxID=1389203 RepID=A0A9Q3BCG6_9BASI|nr:hypothetical protein [Austropuccinia psidii MF-1]